MQHDATKLIERHNKHYKAWTLWQSGTPVRTIAKMLGVHHVTIWRWCKAIERSKKHG